MRKWKVVAAAALASPVALILTISLLLTSTVTPTQSQQPDVAPKQPTSRGFAPTVPGIPSRMMAAFRAAVTPPPCPDMDWRAVAAIAQVETEQGTVGFDLAGRWTRHDINLEGKVVPPVFGAPLDGSGPQQSRTLDAHGNIDTAAGAMQWTSPSWAEYGRDEDGDRIADRQDIDDAAPATARYLCKLGWPNMSRAFGGYNAGPGGWNNEEGTKYAERAARAFLSWPETPDPRPAMLVDFTRDGDGIPYPNAPDPPVQPRAIAFAIEIESRFGPPPNGWRGWRPTWADSISGGQHPVGLAIDYYGPSRADGDRIADWIIHQKGVRYVIWWERIWTPDDGWQPYNQAGESMHYDHIHTSLES
jgi:hypothetical protein